MLIIVFCLLFGIMFALFMPFNIPSDTTVYVAVALIAGFDSIFGDFLRAAAQGLA